MPVHIWDIDGQGNYWSDYQGFDADFDGIGDEPYSIDSDNVDFYPLIYPYDIEKGTVMLPIPKANPEPFPLTLLVVSAITVSVISVSLLVYFKKRKHFTDTRV